MGGRLVLACVVLVASAGAASALTIHFEDGQVRKAAAVFAIATRGESKVAMVRFQGEEEIREVPFESIREVEVGPEDSKLAHRLKAQLDEWRKGRSPPEPPEPAPKPGPEPAAAPAAGRTFVLVVGVDAYRDERIPFLRFAEADARDVYGFFATSKKSPTDPDRVQLLLGKDATRAAVLRALREHLAAKATRPEDTAILYFAGHGFADAQDTYLATRDADLDQLPETSIAGEVLRLYWDQIRAGNKVILTDACRSGGLRGVRGIGGVRVAPEPGAGTGTGAETTSLTIAATGPNELSTEDEKLGHGVFTIALVNGLRGEADADGDGRVNGDELGAYLAREVPALAAQAKGKQTPVVEAAGAAGRIWLTR